MVETTVDLEALDRHEFIIKSEFDDGLRIIRKKLNKLQNDIESEHRRACDDLNQDPEKKLFLENHRVHGWCLRLTRNEAGCIRGKKQYQEITTQKNGVYFTTTSLASMRREFDQLSENYNRTQGGLVSEVVAVAASYTPVVERLASVLAHLDVIVAFSHASIHAPIPYTRPKLYPRASECLAQGIAGETRLLEARHPCLEQQDDVSFITNDVHLAPSPMDIASTDPTGPSFLIITGPNMGGKSTYIRQLACIALLAQTGCFVPAAQGATLTIYDSILARVGASDSQLKGVSTFMAEMLETANILKSATRDSLIVIDELGRGTSTYDGFGLAWAIAEFIVKSIGAQAAFATHFHELTRLGEMYKGRVANLHVVAHVDDATADGEAGEKKKREVTLLYRVEPGVSDQSFGIHVAELVRFPQKVINMAKRKAAELEDFEGKDEQGEAMDVDGGEKENKPSQEEIEQGTLLLKQVLKQWKAEVDGKGLSKQEQVGKMKELVKGNEALLANPFFKGIKAL
jgi:DNA mismatch repair protein MSH2